MAHATWRTRWDRHCSRPHAFHTSLAPSQLSTPWPVRTTVGHRRRQVPACCVARARSFAVRPRVLLRKRRRLCASRLGLCAPVRCGPILVGGPAPCHCGPVPCQCGPVPCMGGPLPVWPSAMHGAAQCHASAAQCHAWAAHCQCGPVPCQCGLWYLAPCQCGPVPCMGGPVPYQRGSGPLWPERALRRWAASHVRPGTACCRCALWQVVPCCGGAGAREGAGDRRRRLRSGRIRSARCVPSAGPTRGPRR